MTGFSGYGEVQDNPITVGRLSVSLGPEVKRAAPEFYVGCLAEGARSIREWMDTNFGGCKNHELFVEV